MTRCPAAGFLLRHDVEWVQKRDDAGLVAHPHALVWVCRRCGRVVGETVQPPADEADRPPRREVM